MRKYLAVAAVAALALVGCSKTETSSNTTTTTTQAAPSKADTIKAADAICEKYKSKVDALEPESVDELEDSLKGLVTTYQDEIKELRALPKPAEGATEWDAMLTELEGAVKSLESSIPDIVEDPSSMQDAAFVKDMKKASDDAAAFGLKVCGQDSDSSSSSSSDGETSTTKKK
jgi:hypothetical protein